MRSGWRTSPAVIGFLIGIGVLALFRLVPAEWRFVQQERTFDALLHAVTPLRSPAPAPNFILIDIDAPSIKAAGRWPWKRETMAALVSAVAGAGPTVIALDIVFAGVDTHSPAALARRLGADIGRADLAELAAQLPDGDRALARAMQGKPVVLGWILDPNATETPPPAPVILRGPPDTLTFWRSSAASAPGEPLAGAAAGAGTLSLPGDPDGVVRRVPLLVSVGAELFPGFAAEILRIASGASAHILTPEAGRIAIGDHDLPLARDGMLRLAPRRGIPAAARISAEKVLNGQFDHAALKDKIVIIGGSAAETGGLRAAVDDPLTPSSLIHAAALDQLANGFAPRRPAYAGWLEGAAAVLVLALAIVAASFLRPLPSLLVFLAALATLLAATLGAASRGILINPAPGFAAAGLGFAATLIGAFSQSRLREARLRRRFEQHLAPGVVERIVNNPDSLRLTGERRVVTALFTDIEGFTATARDTDPAPLIAVLDGYFEGISRIVVEHGGMVDKFVGDAVLAFFNLPFDSEGHQASAIACAEAVAIWSEEYRRSARPQAIGLGRTRIGIETGPVVAGDVGLSTKLDYTAYGSAVNLASRLESMNKQFGTTILIGPDAARAAGRPLRSLGQHEIRGFGTAELFTVLETARAT